jgi:hypothetical protein
MSVGWSALLFALGLFSIVDRGAVPAPDSGIAPETRRPVRQFQPRQLPPIDDRQWYTTGSGRIVRGTPEEVRQWREEDEKAAKVSESFQAWQRSREQAAQQQRAGLPGALMIAAVGVLVGGLAAGVGARTASAAVLRIATALLVAAGLVVVAMAIPTAPTPPQPVAVIQE